MHALSDVTLLLFPPRGGSVSSFLESEHGHVTHFGKGSPANVMPAEACKLLAHWSLHLFF